LSNLIDGKKRKSYGLDRIIIKINNSTDPLHWSFILTISLQPGNSLYVIRPLKPNKGGSGDVVLRATLSRWMIYGEDERK